ncbi:MAG: peptidase S41 [Bacteroidales bacterium]|nr:peptidase S41 [Bacteroidales bacterium]
MVKKFLTAGVMSMAAIAAMADAPLWLRDVAISPDGTTVAFTYKGDIYTVPVAGGRANRLTTSQAYDSKPSWRPDGKQIVFRSNREGSDDLYIMNAKGGTPRRLTTHSGQETPLGWMDNNTLVFNANVMPAQTLIEGPFWAQTYSINVDNESPRPSQEMSINVMAASWAPDGAMLYQDRKGVENLFRKHERSSGTSDIWYVSPKGEYNKLTSFEGHDLNPVWKRGSQDFFYVSEKDGTLNVYERSLDGKNERQLTRFKKHPVRSLSASDNGVLAFSWDGEAYTLKPGAEPVKLNVEIVTDDYDNDRIKHYITGGASRMAVSPSGNEVAFVVRGDIYVTNTKYKTTKRITNTAAQERTLDFAPDGRSLVYDSDRDGQWKLYMASIVNPDEKEFAYATDIKEELLYSSKAPAQQPDFSPDGKKVAFLEDRTTLRVIDVKSKKVNTALNGDYNYSYTDGDISFEWSPDSRWLLCDYIGVGGWNNSDIALVAADGSKVVDLTESGYADSSPQWVLGGKGITYKTGKYGMKSHGSWGNETDVILMMLDTEAWDNFGLSEEDAALAKKEKARNDSIADASKPKPKNDKKDDKEVKKEEDKVTPLEFDLDNRRYRQRRLTNMSGNLGGSFLSPEGDKFYYVAVSPEGKANLMCRNLRDGSLRVLIPDFNGGFVADAKGENLFVLSNNGLSKVTLSNGERKPIEFEAIYERHPSQERDYIYGHMWQQVKDKFYDSNIHGVDWAGYGSHYRRFLPHIDNNRDFADMLSEILGELNASHTGSGTSSGAPALATASLGAFYDPAYKGNGLKVTEVLPRSPLASKNAHVVPGDIIMAINGNTIEAGHDYFPLLEGLSGRKTTLTVKRASTGKDEDIVIRPINAGIERDLLYQRWVERNEAIVDSVSGGRIGYVHVQGMDSPSFRTVYDRLLGKYRNCDAVIVDTRHNGGGWLHNDIAQLLSGKEYVRFTPRDKYIGSEPFSQWTKPSVMLVNESNYSDAHGTPFVYQTLGIGDIVGSPVPGTMTAVWWETQIDPAIYFGIPQVTSRAMDGTVLENHQLNPDVLIYNKPDEVQAGHDAQLEGATLHLLKQLNKK